VVLVWVREVWGVWLLFIFCVWRWVSVGFGVWRVNVVKGGSSRWKGWGVESGG